MPRALALTVLAASPVCAGAQPWSLPTAIPPEEPRPAPLLPPLYAPAPLPEDGIAVWSQVVPPGPPGEPMPACVLALPPPGVNLEEWEWRSCRSPASCVPCPDGKFRGRDRP